MWATLKAGVANAARNAFTDNDGDFCPATLFALGVAVVLAVRFVKSGSVDFTGFAQAESTVLAGIALKRWSERK